jgi:hypothetical protein
MVETSIPFPHVAARVRRLLTALGALLVVFSLSATAAHATVIGWDDFARPDGSGPTFAPSGGDRIALQIQDGVAPSGRIEVVLKTPLNITWRKGIEADRRATFCNWFTCWTGDQFFRGTYTQDDDHNQDGDRISLSVSDAINGLGAGQLRFGKAAFLGIYTGFYELRWDPAHTVSGRRYTFTWLRD